MPRKTREIEDFNSRMQVNSAEVAQLMRETGMSEHEARVYLKSRKQNQVNHEIDLGHSSNPRNIVHKELQKKR